MKPRQDAGSFDRLTILLQDVVQILDRVKAKQSFREFRATRRTIEGYEAVQHFRISATPATSAI